MAIVSRAAIKQWFLTGLVPLQEQYHDWLDSFWHKTELQFIKDQAIEEYLARRIYEVKIVPNDGTTFVTLSSVPDGRNILVWRNATPQFTYPDDPNTGDIKIETDKIIFNYRPLKKNEVIRIRYTKKV